MPLPLIPLIVAGAAAGATAIAGKKGYDSVKNMKETKRLASDIEEKYQEAYDSFDTGRLNVNNAFEEYGEEKLTILDGSMSEFIGVFSQLKNVDFSDRTVIDRLDKGSNVDLFMREIKKQTVEASKVLAAGVSSIAGGGLAAMGALGAATTFGAATTGTALASLTGVAATNATLAFFGGGSLAAGGLGMAGGMVVLGGIALAPALAIGSVIFASSTEKKLEEMKIQQAEIEVEREKLLSAKNVMFKIEKYTLRMKRLAVEVDTLFTRKISELAEIIEEYGVDYSRYTESQKVITQQAYTLAVTMKHLLDTPILTEEGELSPMLKDTISVTKEKLSRC